MEESDAIVPTPEAAQDLPAPDAQEEAILDAIEDEVQPTESPAPKLRVKVDGTEREVSTEELVQGYSKAASADERFRAAAEARKQADAIAQQARQAMEYHQQQLSQFIPDAVSRLQELQKEMDAISESDPARWVVLKNQFDKGVMQVNAAEQQRQSLQAERQAQEARDHAARVQNAYAYLAKNIQGWAPDSEIESKVSNYAEKLGIDKRKQAITLGHIPEVGVALHKAMLYDALMQKVSARKATSPETTEAPTPLTSVKSRAPSNRDPDKMSTDEWMKWRNKQLRAQS